MFPLEFLLKWQVNSVCYGLMILVVVGYGESQAHILSQKEYGPKRVESTVYDLCVGSVLFVVECFHFSSIAEVP